jgi:hypothetical protein
MPSLKNNDGPSPMSAARVHGEPTQRDTTFQMSRRPFRAGRPKGGPGKRAEFSSASAGVAAGLAASDGQRQLLHNSTAEAVMPENSFNCKHMFLLGKCEVFQRMRIRVNYLLRIASISLTFEVSAEKA